MDVVLLRAVPLVSVLIVLALWLPQLKRPDRSPASVPLCRALGAGAVALAIQLAYPVLDDVVTVPSLPHFFVHVGAVMAVYWLSVFALHASQAPSLVQKIMWRRAALIAALAVLTATYIAGPLEGGLTRISPEASAQPWVLHYNGTYSAFIAFAMIDVVHLSSKAGEANQVWVRRGLRVIGIGAIIGFGYAVARLAAAVVYTVGGRLPWATGGPSGPTTVLMLIAAVLVVAGLALPAMAQWLSMRRQQYDDRRRDESS